MPPGNSWEKSKKMKTRERFFAMANCLKYRNTHNTKCDSSAMLHFFSARFARRLLVATIFKFVVPSCFFAFIALTALNLVS